MSDASAAALTTVLERLNMSSALSFSGNSLPLRVVGYCGSAHSGRSSAAHALIGNSRWPIGGTSSATGGDDAFANTGYSGFNSSASSSHHPSSSTVIPRKVSSHEALQCSPMVRLSECAGLHGVSMGSHVGVNRCSSDGFADAMVMAIDCAAGWGNDGLERAVGLFLPMFAAPGGIVVWSVQCDTCTVEDAVMGLYVCCTVASQITTARLATASGSAQGSSSCPPSLIIALKSKASYGVTNDLQELYELLFTDKVAEGVSPAGNLRSPLSTRGASQPAVSASSTVNLNQLRPLVAVVRKFFAENVAVHVGDEKDLHIQVISTAAAPPLHHQAPKSSSQSKDVVLSSDQQQQSRVVRIPLAADIPTAEDVRIQYSLLREIPTHTVSFLSGGGGRSSSNTSSNHLWSWLPLMEADYYRIIGGPTVSAVGLPSTGGGNDQGSPSDDSLQLRKRDDFLVEDALDAFRLSLRTKDVIDQAEGNAALKATAADWFYNQPKQSTASSTRSQKTSEEKFMAAGEMILQEYLHDASHRKLLTHRREVAQRLEGAIDLAIKRMKEIHEAQLLANRPDSEVRIR